MIQGVKHIVFDLGGVILNIDYSLTEQAFVAAGIQNFANLYSQLQQTSVFNDLETGKMSSDDFVAAMQQISGGRLSKEAVLQSWNAMLLDFPIRRLQILQQLRNYYDLFLLSNTNEIHELSFNSLLQQQHGIPSLGVFFDKVYYSHRIGMRKPDREIFEHVLHENGLQAKDTLFIDDSPQHITAAKELGIQTIHLTKGMTIEVDVFRSKEQ
jgi:glucose-1-phosphatase